ncbi:MAG: hypothetical protein AAGD35_12915 [Actinomycetota bacterium]
MTRQESFKRRVRRRMATTGERYATARRRLLAEAGAVPSNDGATGRRWVAPPETSDAAVVAATGRGWNEWCDWIEASAVAEADHPAIAAHLAAEADLDGWWSQTVTVGFERITGRRLPYQRPDGTFTAGKTMTVPVDGSELRAALVSADDRAELFPGQATELRSAPTAKTIRIGIGPGVARIAVDGRPDGGTRVAIQHEKLPTFDDVDRWRHYWDEWLRALAAAD